jgi:tRNA nucleotidyltransferase (CCA-adding enzyme)
LQRLSEFGLLKVIHHNLVLTEELDATLRSMQETLSWFNLLFFEEKPDSGILYLMALLSGSKDEDMKAVMERLSPSPRVKETVISGIVQARNIVRRLPLRDPAEICKLLSGLNLETILFSMALSKDRQKQKVISRYLTELRSVKTILTGDDLKRMGLKPGPVYSKILRELLEEKMRGRLKSREDEEKFVSGFIQG